MHRIGMVGVSWQQRRPDLLAAFTIPREERPARLPGLASAVAARELVYLATCNRVELVFAADASTPIAACRRRVFAALGGRAPRAGEVERALRAWQGEGAAEHLFLVAAGLDSARMGESEIAGQVREALELARGLGLVGPRLEAVFTAALRVAKRVRPLTEGRIGRVSLADLAVRRVVARLAETPGTVALIGAGAITERCVRALVTHGVPAVIVNRTVARAEALAARLGCAGSRSLEAFRSAPEGVEALIVATGSREPVLTRADLELVASRTPSGASPLVVDLGVPPNVAPEDAAAADVPRVGIEEISEEAAADRERLLPQFAEARAIVDEALTELRRATAERLVGSVIAGLRRRYRDSAAEGVERLLDRDLAGLGEDEREIVRRWAETLSRRLAHVPSVGLRELAFRAGPAAVEAFFSGSAPELAQALQAASDRTDLGPETELDQ